MFIKDNLSHSPEQTFQFGIELAQKLDHNSCLLITGNLGAGKTQLIKGICSYFGIDQSLVQSPTYSLHHSYTGLKEIQHFDLYRLNDSKEFIDRGFLDVINCQDPICIEWPEKIDKRLLSGKNCVLINIEYLSDTQRNISISHG